MSKKMYDETYINNIALALQTASGSSDKYYVSQMADAILNLGSGGDSILNNAAADAVVDLLTKVTDISAFKMYRATALETVNGVNLESLGNNAFNLAGNLYSVKCKQALAINKETFRDCGKLYKICPENINYVGVVAAMPFTSVTIANNPHGGNISYISVSDYDFIAGDVVYNESDYKLYKFDGDVWSEYIPEYGFAGGNLAFRDAPNFAVLPFLVYDIFTPTGTLADKKASFNRCGLKNIYLDADNFTAYNRDDISEGMFEDATQLKKVWILHNGTLSDDISLIFTTIAGGMFYNTQLLTTMSFTNVTKLYKNSFSKSGIEKIIAPNVTVVGDPIASNCPNLNEIVVGGVTDFPRYFADNCPNLEKVSIGNGSAVITFTNWNPGMFNNNSKMWSLTLNSATMAVAATDETPGFTGTPILNFLGTTTTEITEGSTTANIEISGNTVTATDGKITSYGGKDWIFTNGAWTQWGDNGNMHPVIYVPAALISSYQADANWSKFSPEIWQAIA